MNLKTLGFSLAAGIAVFLVVGVAITELVGPRIGFSLFVGLPAGLVAGAIAAAAVALGLGGDDPGTRRLATAFGAFGAAFVGTAIVVAFVAGLGIVLAMLVGVAAGLVAAAAGYRRDPGGPPDAAV